MNFVYPKPTFANPLDEAIFAAKVYGYTEECEIADFLFGAYFAEYVEFITCNEMPEDYVGNCHLCYSDAYGAGLYFGLEVSAFANIDNVQNRLDETDDFESPSKYQEFARLVEYFRGLDRLKIREVV